MKSPRHMRIIEIDITNACSKRCSNCTRFCGHFNKPYFMDFDTFKRAVDSLDGFQGIRSMIGGEPTLHPEFERFIRYLGSKFPPQINHMIYPQKEFMKAMPRVELENCEPINDGIERLDVIGAGTLSNMGVTYKKHYEIINDTLTWQGLNDHINPIYHQAWMITRKDLGIPDDEWYKLRDACWLQNEWSATITPKGAFFCEVAGSLDMMFDGPGGWPMEPGWWKREPKDFSDQLHWCELCGFALDTFTRESSEEIDDVSPTMYKMLEEVKSQKLKSGRYNLIKIENGIISEESKKENKHFSPEMPYIEHFEDRFNALNSILFAHEYRFAVIPDGVDFGIRFNKLLKSSEEWIVLHSPNAEIADDFSEQMSKYMLNPGTMHYLDLSKSNDTRFVTNADVENTGYAALFSKNAISLREFGFDRIAHTKCFDEIVSMWKSHKVIELSSKIDNKILNKGVKYAIWGTDSAGIVVFNAIKDEDGEIVLAVDKDKAKHGQDFNGITIQPPEELLTHINEFDVLIAASHTRFLEIKREAVSMGIDERKITVFTCQWRYEGYCS